jgi:hypothetical protein
LTKGERGKKKKEQLLVSAESKNLLSIKRTRDYFFKTNQLENPFVQRGICNVQSIKDTEISIS